MADNFPKTTIYLDYRDFVGSFFKHVLSLEPFLAYHGVFNHLKWNCFGTQAISTGRYTFADNVSLLKKSLFSVISPLF